jgi:phage terminase large subunit GpA-like protein
VGFKQLTAEELSKKTHRGYSKYIWQKTRPDNHALDCRIYARAAATAIGLDRMTAKDFDRLKAELGLAARKKIRVEDSRAAAYEMV